MICPPPKKFRAQIPLQGAQLEDLVDQSLHGEKPVHGGTVHSRRLGVSARLGKHEMVHAANPALGVVDAGRYAGSQYRRDHLVKRRHIKLTRQQLGSRAAIHRIRITPNMAELRRTGRHENAALRRSGRTHPAGRSRLHATPAGTRYDQPWRSRCHACTDSRNDPKTNRNRVAATARTAPGSASAAPCRSR